MIISIASGKGGTGKTTVATNLVAVTTGAVYADCDVEEPNGHIFLKPEFDTREPVYSLVPRVDHSRCTFCGKCQEACRFNAIVVLPKSVMVFDELCHSCSGCMLACPEDAIHEEAREIGVVEQGRSDGILFVHGTLSIGEAMSPPVIRAVKKTLPPDGLVILDAPPGTSCPAVTSVQGTDACLLVTEPTPFGLHDLKLAVEMVRALGVPFGVVINRDGAGDDRVDVYCRTEGIPVLARIPESRELAVAYSKGILAIKALPAMKSIFEKLLQDAVALGRPAGQPAGVVGRQGGEGSICAS